MIGGATPWLLLNQRCLEVEPAADPSPSPPSSSMKPPWCSWHEPSKSSCCSCLATKKVTGRNYFPIVLVRTTTSWWCALPFGYFLMVCALIQLFSTTSRRIFMKLHYFHSFYIKLDRLLQTTQHVDCWKWHCRCLRHWSCLRVQT
jgi:hypothetical protein